MVAQDKLLPGFWGLVELLPRDIFGSKSRNEKRLISKQSPMSADVPSKGGKDLAD